MDKNQYLRNLVKPEGLVDVVLDTDAYNEIDDQFAISLIMKMPEKFNVKALYAAPFFNGHSTSPKDGMEKSYYEILNLLKLRYANILSSNTTEDKLNIYFKNKQLILDLIGDLSVEMD